MALINSVQDSLNTRLGYDVKFPIAGNFEPISGIDLVLQDIQTLLLTVPGEKLSRPTWGCGLRHLIWENIDDAATKGAAAIKYAINVYEPRVKLLGVSQTINRNTDLITYTINFQIINTDTTVNLIFPFRTGTALSFA